MKLEFKLGDWEIYTHPLLFIHTPCLQNYGSVNTKAPNCSSCGEPAPKQLVLIYKTMIRDYINRLKSEQE